MIELNLLPEELKKKKKRIELPEIPIIPIAVALIGVLVIIQLLLGGLIFWNTKQLAILDKSSKSLLPKKAEFDGIKKKVSAIDKKNRAIEDLIQKRLNLASLLNNLSDSVTSNIWLTELAYDERGKKIPTLTLSGLASGKSEEATARIAHFIKALKDNKSLFKVFSDVELVSIKKGSMAEQDVMVFDLICRFKPQEARD